MVLMARAEGLLELSEATDPAVANPALVFSTVRQARPLDSQPNSDTIPTQYPRENGNGD